MNQAFHLYRLQQIDTQIDQAAASLADIEKLLSGDETVRQARQSLEGISKQLHQNRQGLKQAEFAVKEQQIKIAQNEASLYGGRIRNPKELQDLQKDIASLKKHLAALEDKQLEGMVAVEDAEGAEEAARKNLLGAEANFAEKSAGWLGQKDVLLHTLERLKAERTTAAPPVNPDSMRIYDNIRKRKSGVAVTTARDGSCTVCGATIRPMELQAARSAPDLVYCSFCGRILYVG